MQEANSFEELAKAIYIKGGVDQTELEGAKAEGILKELGQMFADAATESEEAEEAEIIQEIKTREMELQQEGYPTALTQDASFKGFQEIREHASRVLEVEAEGL